MQSLSSRKTVSITSRPRAISVSCLASASALSLQKAKKVGENRTSMLIELELKPCREGRGSLQSLKFLESPSSEDDSVPRVLKTAGIKRSSSEGPPIFHIYDSAGAKIGQIEGQDAAEFQTVLLDYCPECSLSYDEDSSETPVSNVTEQLYVDIKSLKTVLI